MIDLLNVANSQKIQALINDMMKKAVGLIYSNVGQSPAFEHPQLFQAP
jgi:hypothetical protein